MFFGRKFLSIIKEYFIMIKMIKNIQSFGIFHDVVIVSSQLVISISFNDLWMDCKEAGSSSHSLYPGFVDSMSIEFSDII